jgi:dihydrofolate reductase
MGELHATMNVTLDGCCGHAEAIADDELHDWVTTLFSSASALLFGRVTYELLRNYWPGVAAAGTGPLAEVRFARVLEAKPKYVVSRQDTAPGWNTSRLALGRDGGDIGSLKRDLVGNILLVASPSRACALVQAGLVDDYHLAIQPIFAGHGPTFLAGLAAPTHLRLRDANRLSSGVAIHRYRVDGVAKGQGGLGAGATGAA